MLSKIQKIRSIGNYDDYQESGDVALKKNNFFLSRKRSWENDIGICIPLFIPWRLLYHR